MTEAELGEADWLICKGEGRWRVRLSGLWSGERAETLLCTAVRLLLVLPASESGAAG